MAKAQIQMKNEAKKPIALVDLDGTLCDYAAAMNRDMEKITEPGGRADWFNEDAPEYIKERKRLVQDQPGWWRNLEPLPLGFALVALLREFDFKLNILTHGPLKRNHGAWSEKVMWSATHMPGVSVTVTGGEKALTYGAVLVDDFPKYVEPWLKVRPRGLVLMPAQPWNVDFSHPNVLRCTMANLDEAKERIRIARARKGGGE